VLVGRKHICCRPFRLACLSGSDMNPIPHPDHRTGQADLPHPALGVGGRGADRASNDADVSSIPPSFRTAGFPHTAGRLAWQARPSQCHSALDLLRHALTAMVAFALRAFRDPLRWSRTDRPEDSDLARLAVSSHPHQGLVGSAVIGPPSVFFSSLNSTPSVQPRGHIAISPHGRFIRNAFAVRERLGDRGGSGLSQNHSVLACRPL